MPVNKLDSDGRSPYRPRRLSGKGRGKTPVTQNQNHSTSACLGCGKKVIHIPSVSTGTTHAIPVADRVISQMHASLNRKTSTLLKSQKHHNLTPPTDPFSLSVFSINAENKGIEVPVELNRIHLLMELDTGAGVSIISQETYNRHFKETPLQPCNTRLHNPDGSCPKGWWHHTLMWRLCCYRQPPTQCPSVSNSPAWGCVSQVARRNTIHETWMLISNSHWILTLSSL